MHGARLNILYLFNYTYSHNNIFYTGAYTNNATRRYFLIELLFNIILKSFDIFFIPLGRQSLIMMGKSFCALVLQEYTAVLVSQL